MLLDLIVSLFGIAFIVVDFGSCSLILWLRVCFCCEGLLLDFDVIVDVFVSVSGVCGFAVMLLCECLVLCYRVYSFGDWLSCWWELAFGCLF